MNTDLLFDPLFLQPFLTGLVFALLLPLYGAYLRLRGEWLAALSYAQMATAGAPARARDRHRAAHPTSTGRGPYGHAAPRVCRQSESRRVVDPQRR